MNNAFLLCSLFSGVFLNAQLTVDTAAGGALPSGVSAQSVPVRPSGTFTRDPGGNIVFGQIYVIQRINADGVIETIAGTGQSGFSGDGGPATQARLNSVFSPRYDKAGNLYFVDGFRIRRIDANGIITTVVGTGIQGSLGADGPATSAQIDIVTGLEIDAAGNLYFADAAGIRRLTPDGHLQVVAKIGGGPMTLDSAGNFWLFLGQGGQDVYRVAPDGAFKLVAGYRLTGSPLFLRLQTIGAEADSAGNIYVLQQDGAASYRYRVWRITQDLKFTDYLDSGIPATDGDIVTGQITGFAVGDNGALYFADGNRIRMFTPPSNVRTIAGKNFTSAPDGTPARDATLYYPQAFAVSRTGDLYVNEACRIRKIGADGLLQTALPLNSCDTSAAMAVDGRGRVFTIGTDTSTGPPYTNGVVARDPGGSDSILPGTASLGLIAPALATDSRDRLYILASPNLYRWSDAGGLEMLDWAKTAGSNLSIMAIDAADNVYLVSGSTRKIFRFASDGKSSIAGTFPTGKTLSDPLTPFAVDPGGRIWTPFYVPYIGNTSLPRGLALIGDSGAIPIVGCCGYSGDDGPAMSAQMGLYTSIAAGPSGEIYTFSSYEGWIRKISGTIPANRPVISAGGVVNAASLQGGAVAPGELISIFGSNFGQDAVHSFVVDNNTVPGALGNVEVLFNGQRGAITATAPNQVNVFVPYEVASSQSATITVVVDGAASDPFTVAVAKTAFGLSTADASGSGQGAILNQDGSLNNSSNPAAAGTVVTLFGTGEGVTTPALPDGALVLSTPFSTPATAVTVTIGGRESEVLYAGAAPSLPTGVLQINARIPAGLEAGDAPVIVSLGGVSTTRSVTCAVK